MRLSGKDFVFTQMLLQSHLYSSFLAIVHRLTRGCDEFLLTLKDYAVFSTLLIYIS